MLPSAVRQLLRRAIALLQPERELAREMDATLPARRATTVDPLMALRAE